VSFWIVNDVGNTVALLFGELSGSDSWVDSENLADEISESSSNTFNFVKSIGNDSLAVNVGVEDTMNMLEIILWVFNDK
jgi:hypothetical protein